MWWLWCAHTLLCRGKMLLCVVLIEIDFIKVTTQCLIVIECLISLSLSRHSSSSSSNSSTAFDLLPASLIRSECGVWWRTADVIEILCAYAWRWGYRQSRREPSTPSSPWGIVGKSAERVRPQNRWGLISFFIAVNFQPMWEPQVRHCAMVHAYLKHTHTKFSTFL